MTATTSPRTGLPAPNATFTIGRERWASAPAEHRGIPRDMVRLMLAQDGASATSGAPDPSDDRIRHARFVDLADVLQPGDLLVVNTSATRPAAITGGHASGRVAVHLSTEHPDGSWTVELRSATGAHPFLDGQIGDLVALDGGAHLRLTEVLAAGPHGGGVRLWRASVCAGASLSHHMRVHGRPIAYGGDPFLLSDHQTVFARHPGSAEMASAGRPFSDRLVARTVSRGIGIAPITLHAGVSSQTAGEAPQAEWFDVPHGTADQVNLARARGGRVVAVGTTVTRALESAVEGDVVAANRGWTDLVITPDRGVQVVDGLVTGWHEADASHLLLLEAVAGPALVAAAYTAAVDGDYLWHEFGDSCLLLPGGF